MKRIAWILGGGLAVLLLGLGLSWGAQAAASPRPPGAAPLSGTVNAVQDGFESGDIAVGALDTPTATCVPTGCGWRVVTTAHHSGSYAAFAPDVSGAGDQVLQLNAALAIPSDATSPALSFWHQYEFDVNGGQTRDGGVLEVSTNGGATWTDAGGQITGGGYTGTIAGGSGNPLLGRAGWVGTSGSVFTQVQVDLTPYRGQSLLFRLRLGTDSTNVGSPAGWWVDDVLVSWQATVPCLANGWAAAPPYPAQVAANGVVSLGGKVYSLGGAAVLGTPIPDAYRFDPATTLWTPLPPMPAARELPAVVSDGTYVYVVGGTDATGNNPVATLFRYDPAANSWTTLASSSVPTSAAAAAYLNGKIYRIGGQTTGNTITSSVEAYTIATNSWAAVAHYPIASVALYALTLGNYVYTAGGITSFTSGLITTAKTYRYDPAANTWDDSAIADLPGAGRALGGAALYNGRWLFAGGSGDGHSISSSTVAWDPATNTWSSLGALTAATAYTGGATAGGSFYVVGGVTTNSNTGANLVQAYTETMPSFTDVHTTDYFYTPVGYLACHGVISGYADGTFRPYANTTRAQMVKIVTLGFRLPSYTPPSGYTFADVPPAAPFWSVIETAVHDGVVSGYACGGPGEPCDSANRPYFRPNVDVTRGQLSKIVVVAAGWPLRNPPTPTFRDVPPASPFYQYVETAACYGVISGYACGGPGEPCDPGNTPYFRLGNDATRGQIAKIVYLAVNHPAACAAPAP